MGSSASTVVSKGIENVAFAGSRKGLGKTEPRTCGLDFTGSRIHCMHTHWHLSCRPVSTPSRTCGGRKRPTVNEYMSQVELASVLREGSKAPLVL
jgi:hypothetical protein